MLTRIKSKLQNRNKSQESAAFVKVLESYDDIDAAETTPFHQHQLSSKELAFLKNNLITAKRLALSLYGVGLAYDQYYLLATLGDECVRNTIRSSEDLVLILESIQNYHHEFLLEMLSTNHLKQIIHTSADLKEILKVLDLPNRRTFINSLGVTFLQSCIQTQDDFNNIAQTFDRKYLPQAINTVFYKFNKTDYAGNLLDLAFTEQVQEEDKIRLVNEIMNKALITSQIVKFYPIVPDLLRKITLLENVSLEDIGFLIKKTWQENLSKWQQIYGASIKEDFVLLSEEDVDNLANDLKNMKVSIFKPHFTALEEFKLKSKKPSQAFCLISSPDMLVNDANETIDKMALDELPSKRHSADLHFALLSGHIEKAKAKLEEYPWLANYEASGTLPPVISAVHHSFSHTRGPKTLALLSDFYADYNAESIFHNYYDIPFSEKLNPLAWLLINGGDSRLVGELLDRGTSPNHASISKVIKFIKDHPKLQSICYQPLTMNPFELSPLELVKQFEKTITDAAQKQYQACIQAIFDRSYPLIFNLLHEVENGHVHLKEFLNRKDPQGENGATILHYAVRCCNLKIIKLLLEKGANPNALDNDNQSPLDWAVLNGSIDKVKLLREYGANLSHYGKHINALVRNASTFFNEDVERYTRFKNKLAAENRLDNPALKDIKKLCEKRGISWLRDSDITDIQMSESAFGQKHTKR